MGEQSLQLFAVIKQAGPIGHSEGNLHPGGGGRCGVRTAGTQAETGHAGPNARSAGPSACPQQLDQLPGCADAFKQEGGVAPAGAPDAWRQVIGAKGIEHLGHQGVAPTAGRRLQMLESMVVPDQIGAELSQSTGGSVVRLFVLTVIGLLSPGLQRLG